MSRAQSIMNLTASTLFGIYGPATGSSSRAGWLGSDYMDRDEPGTPWGTGAESPTYETMPERGSPAARTRPVRGQVSPGPPPGPPLSPTALALSLTVRAALLFALGMGYGVLVSRLQEPGPAGTLYMEPAVGSGGSNGWKPLVFWGVAGVVLGRSASLVRRRVGQRQQQQQ